ncbi:MAG: diguanylate cyclase domain-containing protein, partial [Candidatus Thorarchaeota archaeon]
PKVEGLADVPLGPAPKTSKVSGNQAIVDRLLEIAETKEGFSKSSTKKAADIIADLTQDAAEVDFKGVKGVGKKTQAVIDEVLAKRPKVEEDIPLIPEEIVPPELAKEVVKERRKKPTTVEEGRERRTGKERRQDLAKRKRIEDMTPDEMRQELLVNPVTGILNKRALQEAERGGKKAKAFLDVDSLKYVNDNLGGHAAGDKLLTVVADAVERVAGEEGYHISGDEFIIRAGTKADAKILADRVNEILSTEKLEFESGGKKFIYEGPGVSAGIGKTQKAADALLIKDKKAREKAGLRGGRGKQPPGVREVVEPTVEPAVVEPTVPVGLRTFETPEAAKAKFELGAEVPEAESRVIKGSHKSSNIESLKDGFEQRDLGISIARTAKEELSSPTLKDAEGIPGRVEVTVKGKGLDYDNPTHKKFIESLFEDAERLGAGPYDIYVLNKLRSLGIDFVDNFNGIGKSKELHVINAKAIKMDKISKTLAIKTPPGMRTFTTPEAAEAKFELGAEIPEAQAIREFGDVGGLPDITVVKVGDKYFRATKRAEEALPAELPIEERAPVVEELREPTQAELVAEVPVEKTVRIQGQEVPTSKAAQAFSEYRDSLVRKSDKAIEPKDVAIADKSYATFKTEAEARGHAEAEGLKGEVIQDSLTGEWMVEPDFPALEDLSYEKLDAADYALEREQRALTEEVDSSLDMGEPTDGMFRDLVDIFNNERGAITVDQKDLVAMRRH